ncbi:hypothetical protein [Bacillus sp. P14.5]|uniref:hypothetical protein n=1 Tax=Bacillus sp. P14.5 TaxID=1983400 RepID=UPI0031F4CCED
MEAIITIAVFIGVAVGGLLLFNTLMGYKKEILRLIWMNAILTSMNIFKPYSRI